MIVAAKIRRMLGEVRASLRRSSASLLLPLGLPYGRVCVHW